MTGSGGWLAEAQQVDEAVFTAVAGTETPGLDGAMRRLSRAANYSRLSIGASVILSVAGGRRGREAAITGMTAVACTSAIINLLVKRLGQRRRPDPQAEGVSEMRQVRMPASASFPSGHSAAAVAFAAGVGRVIPTAGIPLHALAGLVGYSRVHTGVHYPGDVVAGALMGAVIGDLSAPMARRASSVLGDYAGSHPCQADE